MAGHGSHPPQVETFGTLEEGIRHGYVAFGAGGFFGEKRLRKCAMLP